MAQLFIFINDTGSLHELLTIKQCSELADRTTQQIYQYLKEGLIKTVRVDKTYVYKKSFEDFLSNRQ